ncbi:MAG: hypothetical protein JO040_04245 [Gemmatimonadetes bacterium]|nr:hypothetical protein [Gemmatimonadota bacterium]
MKLSRRAAGVSLALLLCAGAARAQGQDARVLPRGVVAAGVAGEYTYFSSRLGSDGSGSLGAPFATTFPASFFPALRTVQDSLARFFTATARAGDTFAPTAEDVNLGTLDVSLAADVRRVPLFVEAGVLPRVTARLTVPLERRATELTGLRLAGGTLGLNTRADTLSKLLGKISPSLASIGRLAALPLAGSRAGSELQRRYLRATGDTTTLPLPTRAVNSTQLNTLLGAASLQPLPFESHHGDYLLGDVELAARMQLTGPVGVELSPGAHGTRIAVEAGIRLPTALGVNRDSLLTDVIGDVGHAGATVAAFGDFGLSSRFWVGTAARYTALLARDVERLTWTPGQPYTPLGEAVTVRRSPGAQMALSVAPRYQLTSQIALTGRYGFAHVGETTYEGTASSSSAPTALVGLESTGAGTVQTLGFGTTYSTMASFLARRTNIPLEVWLDYDTAITGTGGVADTGMLRLTGRLFVPAWGKAR